MVSENASAEILGQPPRWLSDFVRLYFRPRTPTFYRNEGIRPSGLRDLDSHCPMPVAFLLDSKEIAGRMGVQFSDRNLARQSTRRGQDTGFLRSLDFQDIYHNQAMGPEDKSELTSRRQAEIIVPDELGLESLKYVATRSEAERQTLLTLLQDAEASAASPEQIIARPECFFGMWSYVERATLVGGEVRLLFNPDTRNAVQFEAAFTWIDPVSATSLRTSASIRALERVARLVSFRRSSKLGSMARTYAEN